MGDQVMEEMELDVKPPQQQQQVACTDDQQQLQLAEVRRLCALVEARGAAIYGFCGEVIAAIDEVAAQVRVIRRLRAEGHGAELAAPARKVEWIFSKLSTTVRRIVALRGAAMEFGRIGIAGGSSGGGAAVEAADALADALQRIHIDISP
ncbi:unnamed protein product [Urochloa humidicola]